MKTLALAVAVLTAAPLAAADLADVKARGTLRVIVMPLSATDEFFPLPAGARPGFDRAVLDGFVALHRIRLEVVPVEGWDTVSYTHLRAHETPEHLVCRLLLE